MDANKEIIRIMRDLRLGETCTAVPDLIAKANEKELSYGDFLLSVVTYEEQQRGEKARQRRLKWAALPYLRSLDEFDLTVQPALNQRQMNELRSLNWIEQNYDLVLLGPTGVGKTFLAAGLCLEAVNAGYNAIFVTMGDLITTLKMEVSAKSAQLKMRRLRKANLIVIDDMMFIALDRQEANMFFHFINDVYESTSIIVTSNKSPTAWGEFIGDEIITGAILDRIVARSEIIQLTGDSYRVSHRQRIFAKDNVR